MMHNSTIKTAYSNTDSSIAGDHQQSDEAELYNINDAYDTYDNTDSPIVGDHQQ